jgi:predicted RNA-binding protein with EMAP domain
MEQQLLNILFGAALAVAGWFARELWSAVQELKSDIAKLPLVYVAKQDYRDDMKDIKDMLSKIFDKLDGKQDK